MTNKITILIISWFCIAAGSVFAQSKKPLSVEDIFKEYTFTQKSVYGINWMNDGKYYTTQVSDAEADYIIKYNIVSGEAIDTIIDGHTPLITEKGKHIRFDSYSFSADETKILFAAETEPIYRRSTKAFYYVYDLNTKKLLALDSENKQSYATFSPDGEKVAYLKDNNIYYKDLLSMAETAVTTDGEINKIIHGAADWVYEEEFAFAKAFFWSPDSKKIAYYTFDEHHVKEYNMQMWGSLYPQDYRFKYPKAGEENAHIKISVYHLSNQRSVMMDIGNEKDIYIPRIYWTKTPNQLSIFRMNRLQNQLEILHNDAVTGQSQVILTEKSPTYVDLNYNDNIIYLSDNKSFIRTNERNGYKHIYLYRTDGQLIRQVTYGNWEVRELIGIDEKKMLIYYISSEDSPLDRSLYSIKINGNNKKRLSLLKGSNRVNMSPDFKYFVNYHSAANSPLKVSLHQAPSGKELKVLQDNAALRQKLAEYEIGKKEFFSFNTNGNISLNGYMIKPTDFDPSKKYPVFMFVYGGPGSQMVSNSWGGNRELWFSLLAQKGYIIACVDNRGTGGRGRDFKHVTYANLGKYEVEDQIEAAKYLGKLPYIDASRIGIWGWSYGGYMSSLALFLGAEYFKMGIAVAPVSNWRFYDSIYTERYLKRPQENAEGYDAYSPINHVDKLKGAYLLIHGTGDDNVHFQNTVALQDALIAADKQFASFYYPNRNHRITGGNTTYHLFKMMTDFIKKEL